jgi:hypothetical protein
MNRWRRGIKTIWIRFQLWNNNFEIDSLIEKGVMMYRLVLLFLLGCEEEDIKAYAEDVDHDWDLDGQTEAQGDCDDINLAVYLGAIEVCDGFDNDCNGEVDVGATDAQIWYQDKDEDGYGVEGVYLEECERPEGYVAEFGDCNDDDPAIHPDAFEVADDNIDSNCDSEDNS